MKRRPNGAKSLTGHTEGAGLTARKLPVFLLSLTLVWGTLQFLIWPALQPSYTAAICGAANLAEGLIEAGQRVTHLQSAGTVLNFYSDLREDGKPALSYNADILHFYVMLFVSLFLVFPGLGVRRRLTLLTLSVAGLFLFHVVVVLINVEHLYAIELAKISDRIYSDAERAFWRWLHDTVDFFAVQFVPGAALLILFVTQGGIFARRVAPDAAPGAARPSPVQGAVRRPARWIAIIALALVALAGVPAYAYLPRIRARQAEKECMLGYRALLAGAVAEAADRFSSALKRNPRIAEAHDGLGLVWMKQERLAEAAAEYRAAIELRPGDDLPHLHLGNALMAMSDPNGALAEFRASAQLLPTRKETWLNIVMTSRKLGRRDETEEALRKVLDLDVDRPDVLFDLSALLIQAGRFCEALPYLERLAVVGPPPERASLVSRGVEQLRAKCGGK